MSKPTYSDIARCAGVGRATVERVLNGRGGVRPVTVERVVLAARELDWPGRLPERHHGIFRIEVVLVRPEANFYSRLARAFRRIGAALDKSLQIQLTFLDESDASNIADHIASPGVRRSALIIVGIPDHPKIRRALSLAVGGGLPIIQLANNCVSEAAFVGIDNYAAGRMAAMLMSCMGARSGKVVAMRHSLSHSGHGDRLRGFSDYFSEGHRDDLAFDFVAFGQDDRALGADQVRACLERWPEVTGIYNAGGGNVGILEELRLSKREVFFVGHELTDESQAAIRDGIAHVILDQLPEAQARRSIDIALSRIGLLEEPIENPPIRFTTITADNI